MDKTPHPIQKAFYGIRCHSMRFFVQPAQILTVKALLDRNLNPTDDEIRESNQWRAMPLYRLCAY